MAGAVEDLGATSWYAGCERHVGVYLFFREVEDLAACSGPLDFFSMKNSAVPAATSRTSLLPIKSLPRRAETSSPRD